MGKSSTVVLTLLSIIGIKRSATVAFSSSSLPSPLSPLSSSSQEQQRRYGPVLYDPTNNAAALSTRRISRIHPLGNQPAHTLNYSSTQLRQSKNDDDDKDEKKDDTDNDVNYENTPSLAFYNLFKTKLTSVLPMELLRLYRIKLVQFFPTLKIAITSFIIGCTITVAAILLPVYDSVDKMTEPVTLFETILADLDRGYVDKVDTKKLFETGVNAMLRSLDPYTEFEGKQEAAEMTESVTGKYGGIGLVISGAVPKKDVEATPVSAGVGVGVGEDGGEGGVGLSLPQDAMADAARLQRN